MKRVFKLLILDCDGTLIISEMLNSLAVSKALNCLGFLEYTADSCMNKFQGKAFSAICQDIEDLEQRSVDKKQFGQLITKFSAENITQIKAVDNADQLLAQINIKKVVASNGHREFVLKYLEQAELLKYFDIEDIFTHVQVKRPKPYPDLFLHTAAMRGVEPEYSIVIEDSATGVRAAKAAGMYAVGFIGSSLSPDLSKSQLLAAGADVIIEDLLEVLELLSYSPA